MQFFPEIAPRRRIDSCRGFIEQQQLRIVEHAGRQGQPLFPASRKRPGELIGPRGQAKPVEGLLHHFPAFGHAVHPRHKIQVFADREVLPEGEFLGHVADAALDLSAFAQDIVAKTASTSRIRGEQSAHHANRRGFSAAVGAKEPEDLAPLHLQRDVLDDVLVTEALVQFPDVDGIRVIHGTITSTGWPGWSAGACSGEGCASIMNTSLARVSLL